MKREYNALRINIKDNIAVALRTLEEGEEVNISDSIEKVITLKNIPYGHKVAVNKIKKGDKIIKYGEYMGVSTEEIDIGEHVHVRNVRGLNGKEHSEILDQSFQNQ